MRGRPHLSRAYLSELALRGYVVYQLSKDTWRVGKGTYQLNRTLGYVEWRLGYKGNNGKEFAPYALIKWSSHKPGWCPPTVAKAVEWLVEADCDSE